MAMDLKEIERLIKEAMPDAFVEIQDLAGDGNQYSANGTAFQFSGTIKKICVSAGSGIIVSRGQRLFEIDPDEPSVSETEDEKFLMQKEYTIKIMKKIVPLY